MKLPIHGIFFRDFSTSYIPEILKELYRDAVYKPFLEDKKDLKILDVGANVGLFSWYASPFATQIIAVEPALEHIEVIKHLIEFNKLGNVTPLRFAVSHENGTANFYHNDNTTMFSLKPEVNSKPEEVETVPTVTLDVLLQMCDLDHVDFMKIDVEGAEAQIFGSEGFDKVKDKIDVIMGEYHQWSGVNPNQFMSYFVDRGFTFEWLNKTEATIFVAKRSV